MWQHSPGPYGTHSLCSKARLNKAVHIKQSQNEQVHLHQGQDEQVHLHQGQDEQVHLHQGQDEQVQKLIFANGNPAFQSGF